MSDRRFKKGVDAGKSKIDLGLESLLSAVAAEKRTEPAAEVLLTTTNNNAEVESLNTDNLSYISLYREKKYQELENLCLDRLQVGFDVEAKLWWIRSVNVRAGLPKFLLSAPYEEAREKVGADPNLVAAHQKLLDAIAKELGLTVENAHCESSSKNTTTAQDNATEIPISVQELVADKNVPQNLRLRFEAKTQIFVVGLFVLVALLAYFSFRAPEVARDQRLAGQLDSDDSKAAVTEASAAEGQIEKVSADGNLSKKILPDSERSAAVLEKLRADEEQLRVADDTDSKAKSKSQKQEKHLKIEDILDLVNEDPEVRFEEHVRKADKEEEQQKTAKVGTIERIKEDLAPSQEGKVRQTELDLSGPVEPDDVARIMDRADSTSPGLVAARPELVDAFSMAGYQREREPIKALAKPLVITKPGKVYTNTSTYAVEIEQLNPGDEVWLIENQGAWLKIASREGEVGFIDAKMVS